MKRFLFEWWDSCEWAWMDGCVIAPSKTEAIALLRNTEGIYISNKPFNPNCEDSLSYVSEETYPIQTHIEYVKRRRS